MLYSPRPLESSSPDAAPPEILAAASRCPAARVSIMGPLLTKWTIRLALACYVAYLAGWLTAKSERWPGTARWLWTGGCALFVVHVACAFHFYHGWSHAAAWQTTADETRRMLGFAFGDGIYGSYLFLIAWVADVVWLWTGSRPAAAGSCATSVPRPAWPWGQTPAWRVGVHVFLLFIAFNGAIVFESGPTRWFGMAACLALGFLAVRRTYNALGSSAQRVELPRLQEISKDRRTEEPRQMVH